MSVDELRPTERATETGAPGGGRVAVRHLPTPPNARADGLDTRAASLATFLADEVETSAPGARASGRGAQVLLAARAREARRHRVRRTASAGAALGALAAAGLVAWTTMQRPPSSTLSYTVDGAAPP